MSPSSHSDTDTVATTSALCLLAKQLRLPTIAQLITPLAETALNEQWSPERYLYALFTEELSNREQRRITRLLQQASLPSRKTISTFDFSLIPQLNQRQIVTLSQHSTWVDQHHNILLFGSSGVGKTHLACAIAYGLAQQGTAVRYERATDLVQYLQAAQRDCQLPHYLKKLDRYACLIIDDIGYSKRDTNETSVLFELIAHRYERRSLIVTSNYTFEAWDNIFPDQATTIASIDRLVHHSTIIELNTDSYRRRQAMANTASTNA